MFSRDVLRLTDPDGAARSIAAQLRAQVLGTLRRRGAVVGVSGGIDSAVVASLAALAFGPDRVLALLMPERDSSGDSTRLGRMLTTRLGVSVVEEPIQEVLAAVGCYQRQDDAIRLVFPEYGDGWRCKVTVPPVTSRRLAISNLTVEAPGGQRQTARMPPEAYLQLVAATNFKQRVRKMLEYYHADRLAYAVAGTPNRLEYDQGFFVKLGDGAADVKPIAHLYKTQVYELARVLGVPEEIRQRTPTTDTYSMDQTQEEFYFGVPYWQMDLCLYGRNHGVPAAEVAGATGLTTTQVEGVYRDIDQKRRTTRYLHAQPLLVTEGASHSEPADGESSDAVERERLEGESREAVR